MAKGALILVAAFGMTAFAAGGGFMLAAQAYDQHEERIGGPSDSGERRRQPQQSDTDRGGVPRPIERLISNPEPGDGTEREKRDLAAQENTAAWAFWMVFLTGFQVILSGFGIYYIVRTLKHSQHVSYHELRAYLVCGPGTLEALPDGLWKVSIPVRNAGQTPATDVVIRCVSNIEPYPMNRDEVEKLWSKIEGHQSETIGPSLDNSMRFVFPITEGIMGEIKAERACVFIRMQVSYTTYTKERIDEPTFEWFATGTEFLEKTISYTDRRDYAEEGEPNQPNLL